MEFINQLTLEQSLIYIALFTGIIFIAMTGLALVGGDVDADMDADLDGDFDSTADEVGGDGFPIFTIKNLFAFLSTFSISSLMFIKYDLSQGLSLGLGVIVGIVFTIILTSLFYFISKLKQHNVPSLRSTIGKIGTVYLTIPSGGRGQVTIDVNGYRQTVDAVSKSESDIKTGSEVEVISATETQLTVDVLSS